MPSKESLKKSEMMKAYAQGLTDAIKAVHECVADTLCLNGTYYVICYRNGDKNLPYIKRMRLCAKGNPTSRQSFGFSDTLMKMIGGNKDLVIRGKRNVSKRVFCTYEDAQNAIRKMSYLN